MIIKEMLDNIKAEFPISDNDAAFDLLAPSLYLNVSPLIIFHEAWLKEKEGNNENYRNSSKDGKIDVVYFDVNNKEQTINCYYFQNSVGDMPIEKMVSTTLSVRKHFFKEESIVSKNYEQLCDYQKKYEQLIKEKKGYEVNHKVIFCRKRSFRPEKQEDYKEEVESHFKEADFDYVDGQKLQERLKEIEDKRVQEKYNEVTNEIKTEDIIDIVNGDFHSYITIVDSKAIYELINNEAKNNIDLKRLFDDNVRGLLEKTDINEEIYNTIIKEHESFLSYNNGLTVFCDDIKKSGKHNTLKIVNPRILNGQQTVAQIYKAYTASLSGEPVIAKVPCKFVKLQNTKYTEDNRIKLQNKLCIRTNRSNDIDISGLIANEMFFRKLKQKYIRDKINLKIKKGRTLREMFLYNYKNINFEEAFKIWCSIYLERPDYAKAKGKALNLLYKSLFKTEFDYPRITNMCNLVNFKKQMDQAIKFIDLKDSIEKELRLTYFDNAKEMVYYIIFKENIEINETNERKVLKNTDKTTILERLKHIINEEKIRLKKEFEDKDYDPNSFFKTLYPVRHYLKKFGNNESPKTLKHLNSLVVDNTE